MSRYSAYTEHFARALLDPALRPELFEGGAAQVDAGLAVYRNNVMHSLSVALADIYPVVRALVGEEFFSGLARAYIRAEPPASPVLAEYGRSFPAFLENFEPARQAPYLPDVARIERAWLDAWHAPDAEPLDPDTFASLPPEDYAEAVFTCHPSLACIASP
ncbi:MAG: putative DNA-binding domain-containing protein, partial [bacterium]